jgi:hypothetical protein
LGQLPLEGSLFWKEKDGLDLAIDVAQAMVHLLDEIDYSQA